MLDIRLTIGSMKHGGALLSLVIGNYERIFDFAYVPNDALYDLLMSTLRLSYTDSTIEFPHGSYLDFLTIKKITETSCRIEVDRMHFDVPTKAFFKAVLRMFDKFAHDFSVEEYNRHWGGFPTRELERLRKLYHSM